MRKLISLMLVLAIVLACSAAGADLESAKSVNPEEVRNIKINEAGNNEVPDGVSPTTGRNLDEVYDEYIASNPGFDGMAASGVYYPILVLHTGYKGAVNEGAPFYGKSADIYYEIAKASWGVSRLLMVFNDVLPTFAGPTRSLRVQYLFIRQEWNAPLFYQGMQENDFSTKYHTDCKWMINKFNMPFSWTPVESNSQRMTFDGSNGSKDHLVYKYRFQKYSDENNVLWDLARAKNEYLGERDYTDYNHALKFGEQPEGGDSAETVYVYFSANQAYRDKTSEGTTYFNSMYSYDADQGVYYRYMISDLKNPDNNPIPFTEQRLSNTTSAPLTGGEARYSGSALKGDVTVTSEEEGAITFSNVIVQHIGMHWLTSDAPYANLTGSGNADYFIGGKHYTGVWKRNGYDDRTVFYGEDGNEIALKPGRTMIVMMDSFTMDNNENATRNNDRYVKYE